MDPHASRGKPFEIVGWILTVLAVAAYALRIYSRAILTRSLGSDDFMMVFAIGLTIAGEVLNTLQVSHGLGRHREFVSDRDFAIDQKWENIAWEIVFISYFFVRASVMLFVLRLLPHYKRWQHRLIYVLFFVNFAITLIATVTYGVQCKPFEKIWRESMPGTCFSKDLLVKVTQVNGALACVIDILVALVPQFLLWNVSMRPRTKRVLNVIFALGILTSATSIGRAATINAGALKVDTTWRLMPSKWFAMFEEKLGIIFACCPAIRQCIGYRRRVGTFKPTKHRQHGEEDFVKMRGRITWRDVFWFSQKQAVPEKAQYNASAQRPKYDAPSKKPEAEKHPVGAAVQGVSKPDSSDRDVEAAFRGTTDPATQDDVIDDQAHTSRLTIWQRKFRHMFMTSSGSSDHLSGGSSEFGPGSVRRLLSKDSKTTSNHRTQPSTTTQASESRGLTETGLEQERIGDRYRDWGLIPGGVGKESRTESSEDDIGSSGDGVGVGTSRGGQKKGNHEPTRADRDYDLADMLAQPVARPAALLRK